MGEAKRRRAELRELALKQSAKWDFPATPWEATVCAELKNVEVILVPRATPQELSAMRMPLNECHANVRWYAENDPTKKSVPITGWWIQWPDFVLHSIIEYDGRPICITPSHFSEESFPFIPDHKIEWQETGEVFSAYRDGHIIGPGVRAHPEFTMAKNAIFRERIHSGIDIFKAGQFSDEEIETLKEKYIALSS